MIRFHLRDKKSIQATSILMTVYYENTRVKISTGCSVPPKFWMDRKQRVKVTIEFEKANEINDRLTAMEAVMNSLMKQYRDDDFYPSPQRIKSDFIKQRQVPVKNKKDKKLWDHFEDFVEEKRKTSVDIREYNNCLRKHLLKVQDIFGTPLSFALIASDSANFSLEWMNYLSFIAPNAEGFPGLLPNTVGKSNKALKAFLNWCFDKGIVNRFSLKCFPSISEDVDKIYLTEEDLVLLENLHVTDPHAKKVRDLFLVGCESGLRFSDFIRISEHDIRNNELHIIPKKTKNSGVKKLIIPLSERFKTILNSYNGILPNYDKNQVTRFNATIRELCCEANMTDDIKFYREVAGETILVIKKKYEEVSSHTCRRTFCTLKFLKGMPAQAIMKFSGHKSERNFLKYLKLDAELTARTYASYF
jgi:integrase